MRDTADRRHKRSSPPPRRGPRIQTPFNQVRHLTEAVFSFITKTAKAGGAAKITIALGLVVLAVVGAITLMDAPPRVVRSVGRELVGRGENAPIGFTTSHLVVCQTNEALPAGVVGVRLWMRAFYGTPVHLALDHGSHILATGAHSAAWTGQSVTVPVTPLSYEVANVALCFAIGPNSEPVTILGASAPARLRAVAARSGNLSEPGIGVTEGEPLTGRTESNTWLPVTARGGRVSWAVARRMGLGRAVTGTWIALLAAVLMAVTATLAIRQALRELP